jgi:hypothetical protein
MQGTCALHLVPHAYTHTSMQAVLVWSLLPLLSAATCAGPRGFQEASLGCRTAAAMGRPRHQLVHYSAPTALCRRWCGHKVQGISPCMSMRTQVNVVGEPDVSRGALFPLSLPSLCKPYSVGSKHGIATLPFDGHAGSKLPLHWLIACLLVGCNLLRTCQRLVRKWAKHSLRLRNLDIGTMFCNRLQASDLHAHTALQSQQPRLLRVSAGTPGC